MYNLNIIKPLHKQAVVLVRGPRCLDRAARAPDRGVHQDLRQLSLQTQEEDHGLHRSDQEGGGEAEPGRGQPLRLQPGPQRAQTGAVLVLILLDDAPLPHVTAFKVCKVKSS